MKPAIGENQFSLRQLFGLVTIAGLTCMCWRFSPLLMSLGAVAAAAALTAWRFGGRGPIWAAATGLVAGGLFAPLAGAALAMMSEPRHMPPWMLSSLCGAAIGWMSGWFVGICRIGSQDEPIPLRRFGNEPRHRSEMNR